MKPTSVLHKLGQSLARQYHARTARGDVATLYRRVLGDGAHIKSHDRRSCDPAKRDLRRRHFPEKLRVLGSFAEAGIDIDALATRLRDVRRGIVCEVMERSVGPHRIEERDDSQGELTS